MQAAVAGIGAAALPLFAAYQQEGTGSLRRLASWILGTLHPASARTIVLENAPLNVEVVLQARGRDRIVHLLTYTADKRIDLGAVHGIRVGVRCATKPKRVQPGSFEYKEGWAWFDAQPLKLHAVYVLES